MRKSYHRNDPRLWAISSAYSLEDTVSLDGHEGRFDVIGIEQNKLFSDRIDVTFRKHIDEPKPVYDNIVADIERKPAVDQDTIYNLLEVIDVYELCINEDYSGATARAKYTDKTRNFIREIWESRTPRHHLFFLTEYSRDVYKVETVTFEGEIATLEFSYYGSVLKDGIKTFGFPPVTGPRGTCPQSSILAGSKNGPFTQLHRARMNKVKKI